MNAIPFALTSAPNIDNFSSPFEKGYGSGWDQMSDAMKRMQQKRSLDQQDVQLQQNARQQSIDIWKTQIQTSIAKQQMAQSAKIQNQNFGLAAAQQAFEIEKSNRLMPLQMRAMEVETKKGLMDINLAEKDIAAHDNRLATMAGLQKAMETIASSRPVVEENQNRLADHNTEAQKIAKAVVEATPPATKVSEPQKPRRAFGLFGDGQDNIFAQ